jgi:hypothetical protein
VTAHKLIRHGKGADLWGECSCEMWAWLGTYHWPTGRLATLRAEYARHVELSSPKPLSLL